jgi:nitrogen-specific signal transduction histidine kinase/ActR/RegA family two-component response regulator
VQPKMTPSYSVLDVIQGSFRIHILVTPVRLTVSITSVFLPPVDSDKATPLLQAKESPLAQPPLDTPLESKPKSFTPLADETSVESISLNELIEHQFAFQGDLLLSEAHKLFEQSQRTYGAVLKGDLVIGLCSREALFSLLEGDEFSHQTALEPVSEHMLSNPLLISQGTKVKQVLEQAFARTGSEFLQHIVIVDELQRGRFVGLISVRSLVDIQSRLLLEQVQKLSRKEDMLRQTIQQQFRITVELRRSQNRDNNQKQMLRQTVQQQFKTTMELRRSQARYTMLFENSGVGVALMNSEGQITTTNRFLSELLQLKQAKDPIDFGQFLTPNHRKEFLESLRHQESLGERATSAHVEYPVHLPGNKDAIFYCTLNFITETSQHCVCVADVTEERRLQKHLVQKEKDVLLDSFVGGIAHELNNKLLPLMGFTELLIAETTGDKDPGRVRHYGEIIKKSSSECAAIIRQLLSLCQPVASENTTADLRLVTQEALSFLLFRLRETNITFEPRYVTEEIFIRADTGQIKQAVINLALNAVDAMQDRLVRTMVVTVKTDQEFAVLEVQDTGCGIPPEIITNIFDPFFTTKKAETARGLGLSVCRSIARQHKGDITVQSSPGVGSTFILRLPLHRTTPSTPMAIVPENTLPIPTTQDKLKILIVDDEEFVANLVKEVIRRKLDADSDRAANGEEATQLLSKNTYDLIISDVRMPVMSGAELLKWVRQHQPAMLQRFFFITGHEGSSSNTDEISRSGILVLRKPFAMDALVSTCKKVLGQSKPA